VLGTVYLNFIGEKKMPIEPISPKKLSRANIVLIILLLAFCFLLIRILCLQTVDFDKYQAKVIEQMTTESVITAPRGDITDRNGAMLATNTTAYRIFISPLGIMDASEEAADNGISDHTEFVAKGLSELLGVDYDFVLTQTTYTNKLDRTIAKNVYEEVAQTVREFIEKNDLYNEIYLEAVSIRYYPYDTLASSVLGFTSADNVGLYGLENEYNEYLAGIDGKYVTARDAFGNEMPFGYERYIPAIEGYNIKTTLDKHVQAVLEEQLLTTVTECGASNRACGIVMNVNTGEILAMATTPGFDLNSPWTLVDYYQEKLNALGLDINSDEYEEQKKLMTLEMWSNKAITDSYIPGSTFKVITSAMALTEKVVTVDTPFYCPGSYVVSGVTIHCARLQGHGNLTFAEGLKQSCNVVFMQVGQRIGNTAFYNYFKAFGYVEKTGIDLPGEGMSIFHTTENFNELELVTAAFGQNFNITAIQHICALAAVANGGYLVTPYIVDEITDANGNIILKNEPIIRRQVVSTDICSEISAILEEGVSVDGGAKNCYVAGYKIAAKTGTSEKKGVDEGAYICSCVGYAPSNDPQYIALIMIDTPTQGVLYGSIIAAPYIANIMADILPYLGLAPEYTEAELENLSVDVPSYKGWSVNVAIDYAERSGYKTEVIGDGDIALYQLPISGTTVEKENAIIYFYTSTTEPESTQTVPNLVGMTAVAANQTLINSGYNIKIEGTKNYISSDSVATVVDQFPEAGTKVPKGTVVTVTFRYMDVDLDDLNDT